MQTDALHLASAQQVVAMLKAGQVTPLQLVDVTEVRACTLLPMFTLSQMQLYSIKLDTIIAKNSTDGRFC